LAIWASACAICALWYWLFVSVRSSFCDKREWEWDVCALAAGTQGDTHGVNCTDHANGKGIAKLGCGEEARDSNQLARRPCEAPHGKAAVHQIDAV
jgi:hypothetical protein